MRYPLTLPLCAFLRQPASIWINQHLDSLTIQKVATRAFKATERLLFGKAKLVRFKGKGQFASLEGKSNKSGIRWKGNFVEWNTKAHKLTLEAIIDWHDSVIAYGLSCPIKYVRLVRRSLNQKTYWYAQLVCEGLPFGFAVAYGGKPSCSAVSPLQKKLVNSSLVGIDLGVSTVAIVGDDQTLWLPFVPEINPKQKEIWLLQRKMERQRRANNPNNYNPNFTDSKGEKKKGTVKKGKKVWKNSSRYKRTAAKRRSMERKQAAYRKSLHGRLVNDVLTMGNQVKMEKVSVKGWQKLFGKSIGYKAPGYFQSELVRKAESAGGQVLLFSTQKTALSQVCLCGRKQKKPLSLRVHECKCGIKMQRDIFSAFLSGRFAQRGEPPNGRRSPLRRETSCKGCLTARKRPRRYVDPDTETLSIDLARNSWVGMEQSLQMGWQNGSKKPARVEASPQPPSNRSELVVCDLIGVEESERESVNETRTTESEPPCL